MDVKKQSALKLFYKSMLKNGAKTFLESKLFSIHFFFIRTIL